MYSIELAKRMNSSLVLLMLLSHESEQVQLDGNNLPLISRLISRGEAMLSQYLETIERAGLAGEMEIKIGDPASELIKFLAGSVMFQTIIWASEPDLMNKKLPAARSHWLVKIKDVVDCPVVIPTMKSSGAG